MSTPKEQEEFKAALMAYYLPIYNAAREIGISHTECLEVNKIKFKLDINQESKQGIKPCLF